MANKLKSAFRKDPNFKTIAFLLASKHIYDFMDLLKDAELKPETCLNQDPIQELNRIIIDHPIWIDYRHIYEANGKLTQPCFRSIQPSQAMWTAILNIAFNQK